MHNVEEIHPNRVYTVHHQTKRLPEPDPSIDRRT